MGGPPTPGQMVVSTMQSRKVSSPPPRNRFDSRTVAGGRWPGSSRPHGHGLIATALCVAASLGCDPGRYRDVELESASGMDAVELTVGMPAAVSADPGHLTRDAVEAPQVDVSGKPIRTTMRFSAARLVADASGPDPSPSDPETAKDAKSKSADAEMIPTPVPEVDNEPLSPSDPRFLRRLRARRQQQAAMKDVERIPTPEGMRETPVADPQSKAEIQPKLAADPKASEALPSASKTADATVAAKPVAKPAAPGAKATAMKSDSLGGLSLPSSGPNGSTTDSKPSGENAMTTPDVVAAATLTAPEMLASAGPDAELGPAAKPSLEQMLRNEAEVKADVAATKSDAQAAGLDAKGMAAAVKPAGYTEWDAPALTLVVTGNQHGYLEPCGCTGLDRQKGGVARRFSFLEQLRDKGWQLAPIDVGNQVRRFGAQAEIKLQQTADALSAMNYAAVGIGPDDVRLGVGPMLAVAATGEDDAMFHSANVVLFDDSMMPKFRTIDAGGVRVSVTSVLDPDAIDGPVAEEIEVREPQVALAEAIQAMAGGEKFDFRVLMFFGEEEAAEALVQAVPGFDLVVVSGGYGEPTFEPMSIEDSQTRMIVTGNKGMYAALVGIDPAERSSAAATGENAFRYARVPLTHEFADAPEMRTLMANYQQQLEQVGLEGLGLLPPIPHSSGDAFVGTATCGQCHTNALAVWEGSMHALATEHIVQPPEERGDVARHFDPECISCHVTGWNPQEYYPYASGYLSLDSTAHLTGNGCENCHGPGAAHSAAEAEDSGVSQMQKDALREGMRLPLAKAKEKCMECHDLDNSPDFHEPDAFEDEYWPEVEHYGMD